MECGNIINLLDNTPNQLAKFRIKNWIEINDQLRGVYNINSDIRFKTKVLKSTFLVTIFCNFTMFQWRFN